MNATNTHEKISPEDPLIAAYAFGELEGDELTRIETAVKSDAVLQAAVAELRTFGGQLSAAFAEEPALETISVAPVQKRRARLIPFPLYYLATAAAAGFAVVVWLQNGAPITEQKAAQRAPIAAAVSQQPTPTLGLASLSLTERAESKNESGPVLVSMDAFAKNLTPSNAPMAFAPASTLTGGYLQVAQHQLTDLVAVASGSTSIGRNESSLYNDSAASAAKDAATSAWTESRRQLNRQLTLNGSKQFSASGHAVITGSYSNASALPSPAPSPANESYAYQPDNAYRTVAASPLSTFSIDVDTASYANVRRFITGGSLPPRDAVRIEELINYFPYAYTPPTAGDAPFAAHLAVASAPWAPTHRLVRIALKGREFTTGARPAANLVFLLDVSGSMNSANKLPLVKASLRLLVERLRADDHVAIVTYASGSGLALPSTSATQKREILDALDNLHAGGGTNGAMGIQLAYDVAKANFVTGGINRVVLCTDGDFNVGITNQSDLVSLIQEKAKSRVFLSVFGFGMGNYKDNTLELLADKGNGSYGYIDTRREAEKVFVEQAEGTLVTIAKDVKIQVEFNPAHVQSYRLIGYEDRLLKKEDFNNDAVDAGEIGAGHTVTALYEVVPVGVDDDGMPRPVVDALKYQKPATAASDTRSDNNNSLELLTVKIRYKAPEGDVSKKQEFPLVDAGKSFADADGDFQFAAAVAGWGMLLRDSDHKGTTTYDQVLAWAENGLGDDAGGYRAEFMQLVRRSAELSQP